MATLTDAEREAFLWMQGRMVELLLRHHERRFRTLFAEQAADPFAGHEREAWLERYRELAVLFYLRAELFEGILPRIKRRLSFEAPRETELEQPPTRGRIDWARTAARSLRERPGEPPLDVVTRQRRRHFATPENLLTVATLLEYRDAARCLLDEEPTGEGSQALRHPLHDIIDRCTRELAFPQFAGLASEAADIVNGHASLSVEEIERAVEERLLPGRNGAYDELLLWRRRLTALKLLDRTVQREPQPMLGADPARDNYLYQLWLLYELGEWLERQGALVEWEYGAQALLFDWGPEGARSRYRLQHDQTIPRSPGTQPIWENAPGLRPDFYLNRVPEAGEPDDTVRDEAGRMLWRRPGVMWDAKYYKPRPSFDAPADTVKRMIADLQLAGERHGALLFAFQDVTTTAAQPSGASSDEIEPDLSTEPPRPTALYRVRPRTAMAQQIVPDMEIGIWCLRPQLAGAQTALHGAFRSLLDEAHARLSNPVPVRCHGFFLDTLTATAHGDVALPELLRQRDGTVYGVEAEALLLCPKPHIGPWRVDLVRHGQCCADASVCHVIGQPGVRPPERLVSLDEISRAIARASDEGDDELLAARATAQVRAIAARYAALFQPDISTYRRWIRDELEIGDLFETTPLLTEELRTTLALGRFLWEQTEHIRATNYAAPTLLFTGVLEEVIRKSFFTLIAPIPDPREPAKTMKVTLGTLPFLQRGRTVEWVALQAELARRGLWPPEAGAQPSEALIMLLKRIDAISQTRNDAAHRANVNAKQFRKLCTNLYGDGTEPGVLNGILLAWQSESA